MPVESVFRTTMLAPPNVRLCACGNYHPVEAVVTTADSRAGVVPETVPPPPSVNARLRGLAVVDDEAARAAKATRIAARPISPDRRPLAVRAAAEARHAVDRTIPPATGVTPERVRAYRATGVA